MTDAKRQLIPGGALVRMSDDNAVNVATQLKDCYKLADLCGVEIVEIYEENDTTAFGRKRIKTPSGRTELRVIRPEFRRLLDDIESLHIRALMAYDLDRVARDTRDLEDLIDAVESTKALTKAATGGLDLSNDAGVTMARIMVAINNKSSRDTSRRVTRKNEELAAAGKIKGGGIRAFGYQRDGLTIDKAEAKWVRTMCRWILAGDSLGSVARRLNEAGVPTVRGGLWQVRSVHSILSGGRIAGLRMYKGEVAADGEWPGIITRDTWDQVKIALAARAEASSSTSNVLTRWLIGVVHCGVCGHGLSGGTTTARDGSTAPRYWCNATRGGCGAIAIRQAHLETYVEAVLLAYLQRPDVMTKLRETTSTKNADRARAELSADQDQLKELARAYGQRKFTMKEFLAARGEIEERIAKWDGVLRAALPNSLQKMLAGSVRDTWHRLGAHERREVAKAVLRKGIRVNPSTEGFKSFETSRIEFLDIEDTQDVSNPKTVKPIGPVSNARHSPVPSEGAPRGRSSKRKAAGRRTA